MFPQALPPLPRQGFFLVYKLDLKEHGDFTYQLKLLIKISLSTNFSCIFFIHAVKLNFVWEGICTLRVYDMHCNLTAEWPSESWRGLWCVAESLPHSAWKFCLTGTHMIKPYSNKIHPSNSIQPSFCAWLIGHVLHGRELSESFLVPLL